MKDVIIDDSRALPLGYIETIVAREQDLPVRVYLYGTYGMDLPDTTIIKEGVYQLKLVGNKEAPGNWEIERKASTEYMSSSCPPPPLPRIDRDRIKNAPEHDPVNNPSHYNSSKATCDGCGEQIECIEITRHMSFNIGNAVKYLWRFEHKGGLEDLKKAQWYLNDAVYQLENENVP